MNENNHAGHVSRVTCHGDEINLLDYWRVILKHKKMIAAIVAAASVVAVISSLLMTNIYQAEAVIVPVSAKGGGGMSALASQFGGLASLAGVSLPGGAGEAEKFMAILKSRTFAENVINRENLMPVLFEEAWDSKKGAWKSDDPKKQPTMEGAVLSLKGMVIAMDDKKTKTIKITGVSRDPQFAARVVNACVDELQRFINANAFTMAKRNRIFIEDQLEENKAELLEAGKEINEFYKGGRVSSAESKVDVPLGRDTLHVTGDRGEKDIGDVTGYVSPVTDHDDFPPLLASNDSETETNGVGVTGHVSRVTDHDGKLDGLLVQKSDLEKKISEAKTVKNVPQQVYLTYLMLRRELLAKVNALLTTQYEMAKIEESKEDLAFQVIDRAVPPEKKFKPRRSQICMMAFMASLFGAVFLAFAREYLARMKAHAAGRSS